MNEQVTNSRTEQEEKSKVKQATAEIKDKAGNSAERAKEQAQEVASKAKREASSAASVQKDNAASELSNVAQALRQTSRQLRQQDQDAFAEYSNRMADQVDRASSYLQDHDVDELINDAQDFARRQPELFLGGAFTLGLLAARFLKSSAPGYGQDFNYTPTRYTQTRATDYASGPQYGQATTRPITEERRRQSVEDPTSS